MDNINIWIILDKDGAEECLNLLISKTQSVTIRELLEEKMKINLQNYLIILLMQLV